MRKSRWKRNPQSEKREKNEARQPSVSDPPSVSSFPFFLSAPVSSSFLASSHPSFFLLVYLLPGCPDRMECPLGEMALEIRLARFSRELAPGQNDILLLGKGAGEHSLFSLKKQGVAIRLQKWLLIRLAFRLFLSLSLLFLLLVFLFLIFFSLSCSGEHSLFTLKEQGGAVRLQKRLDFNPACCWPYVVAEQGQKARGDARSRVRGLREANSHISSEQSWTRGGEESEKRCGVAGMKARRKKENEGRTTLLSSVAASYLSRKLDRD